MELTRLEELTEKLDRLHDMVIEEGYHGACDTFLTRKSPTHYRIMLCQEEIREEVARVK